jgi:hypothetical protein
MAKPREIYNTPAPQAMGQMGAGIAESYGRAGEMMMRGYASAGESIGKGIASIGQAVGQAYGDYKKMSSQVKSSENFYNTMKEGGYLPPEMTAGIDNTVNSDVYKNMGTAEKAQFWGDVKGYTGSALGQYYKMQQIEAEQKGLFNRAMAAKEPTLDLAGLGQGLKQVTGAATPTSSQPIAPEMQFDVTEPAQKLQNFMSSKYGPDYKSKGIRASAQDVIDAGL